MEHHLKRYIRRIGDIRFTIFLLVKLFLLILFATFAQVDRGIFIANQIYFTSWFIWLSYIPIFMGGYTIGLLLVINLLASHATRFRLKRSYIGIFLIHFGLVLLIIGAGLTSFFGHEMQMSISEGTSKNYLEFPSQFEVVIIDASDPDHDRLFSFQLDALRQGIQFMGIQLTVSELFPNAIINQRGIDSLKYNQLGRSFKLISMPKTYKMSERNIPGLELTLQSESSTDYMILWGGSAIYQDFKIQGRSYMIKLRPKRVYLDFSISLLDFSRDTYEQSETPKAFMSKVKLITSDGIVPFDIKMNEPLRFSGYTFFQSSFADDETTSVFQVVKNPSWLIPYLSSLLIVVGLFVQMVFSMGRRSS